MYPDRKETTIYMRRNNTQNNTSTHNTKYKKMKTNIKPIIKNIKVVFYFLQ